MENTYSTRDTAEAAALLTVGCELRDLLWKDKIGYFVFDDKASCEEYSQKYYYAHLEVNARTLMENFKVCKTKLLSEKHGPKPFRNK